MAEPDLTNDFNATSLFSWLFSLFTGPSSSSTATNANSGNSLFSGFENLLKFLFGWLDPQPKQPASTNTATATSTTQSKPASRPFLGRVKDEFNSVTNTVTTGVSNFFHGAAFDISKAISKIKGECSSSPQGSCLAHVEHALTAGGLLFYGGKRIDQVMPVRYTAAGTPTHWAKDLPQVLDNDPRFNKVATGYGANFNANYTPQKGDIVAWTGGQFGHTQMCTGFENGKPIWISDFATSPGNWTGLRDPNSHGQFVIYRQKAADDPTLMASAQPKPAPRQDLNG